jgi:D-aspartate ligase
MKGQSLPSRFREEGTPYAILGDFGNMQALQTARILARRGVPVIGLTADRRHSNRWTRVCRGIFEYPAGLEEKVDFLENFGRKFSDKPVLYPCDDVNVLLVSRHRERLKDVYRMALPDPETVEMLADKEAFYRYAESHGFRIPTTRYVRTREEAREASELMRYPCVIKPTSRTQEWTARTQIKVFWAANAEELLSVYETYHRFTNALVMQQWIEGDESDLYSCNVYFTLEGEPAATFVARKLRQWPPRIGQSSLGEECRDETVLEETLRLFRQVNYRGLGYVEMKRERGSGDYYFVEPNIGRPTGRSAIAEAGGVELHYAQYCDCAGLPLPAHRTQTYGNVKWIHLRRDLQSALYYWRHGELSLSAWLGSLRGRKAYAVWSWRDPLPFFGDLLHVFRIALSPKERGKRLPAE